MESESRTIRLTYCYRVNVDTQKTLYNAQTENIQGNEVLNAVKHASVGVE